MSPGDRIRDFCRKQGLTQEEQDYLLGVLGEAVLLERGRCLKVARLWAEDAGILSWSGREVAGFIARDIEGGA